MLRNDDMGDIPIIRKLAVQDVPKEKISRFWLRITTSALGSAIVLPVLTARGREDGPILGLTAALHGNELNGIPVIQRLFHRLDPAALRGTIVGVPVVNVPSFLAEQRIFPDDMDLNRIMPGQADGNESEVYAHRLLDRLLGHFDYLIDYHTASFGRINSYYIRVNLANPEAAALARLQNADIILHTHGKQGTLRPVLAKKKIVSIVAELGNPHVYQPDIIDRAYAGLQNVLVHLGMVQGRIETATPSIECKRGYWIFTDRGGLLEVFPQLAELVVKGQPVACLRSIFGDEIRQYTAPEDGIVIGKSVNPVNQTGGRILHLGIPA